MSTVEVEVQNLLRQNNVAGANWNEDRKERREQIRHLEKEAFQLANYYFVFQGVIFTAFYHVPHLKCKHHWVPFTLSLLAGGLNFCALLRIALKHKATLDAADTNSAGDDSWAVTCASLWRGCYVFACMFVVFLFLAVTLTGCWLITCGT